jgi:uncharacterized membrane protein YoaK (UPF0700 family)
LEEIKTNIGSITFLLAGIAGFCDTVTFVAGGSIFSAHITGNFVLFAAQLLAGHSEDSWIKLVTFPVFVIAVITGGWLTDKMKNRRRILLIQSLLLILGGLMAILLPGPDLPESGDSMYFIVMITVFAMGLQNTFGKLFAKEIVGPTTIMTGNVTQASLYAGIILRKGIKNDPNAWQNLKAISVTFGGFLTGCFAGAWMGNIGGLATIAIPGIVIMLYYFSEYTVEVQRRYFKRK